MIRPHAGVRLAFVAVAMLAGTAGAVAAGSDCAAPSALLAVGPRLERAAARIARGEGLTILAIGSSSTLGIGASSPQASYPTRLQAELAAHYPKEDIRVVNRGVGGEDAPEELDRLSREIAGDRPDLVIWQVGTNAVLRRDDLAADDRLIDRGVRLLKQRDVDVVLMDLQYAPRVVARQAYADMERGIAQIAQGEHVGLFRRFEIMQAWDKAGQFSASPMIGRDGLHMTDASYSCLAVELADALAKNWRSAALAAAPPQPAPDSPVPGPVRVAPAAGPVTQP